MYVLAPFVLSIIAAAIASNRKEQKQNPEEFGISLPKHRDFSKSIGIVKAGKAKPITTRFGPVRLPDNPLKRTPANTFVPGSAGTNADTESTTQSADIESTPLDPQEQVRQKIENELMMDHIAQEVLEEMNLGEWNEDFEEELDQDFSGSWSHKHPGWSW